MSEWIICLYYWYIHVNAVFIYMNNPGWSFVVLLPPVVFSLNRCIMRTFAVIQCISLRILSQTKLTGCFVLEFHTSFSVKKKFKPHSLSRILDLKGSQIFQQPPLSFLYGSPLDTNLPQSGHLVWVPLVMTHLPPYHRHHVDWCFESPSLLSAC